MIIQRILIILALCNVNSFILGASADADRTPANGFGLGFQSVSAPVPGTLLPGGLPTSILKLIPPAEQPASGQTKLNRTPSPLVVHPRSPSPFHSPASPSPSHASPLAANGHPNGHTVALEAPQVSQYRLVRWLKGQKLPEPQKAPEPVKKGPVQIFGEGIEQVANFNKNIEQTPDKVDAVINKAVDKAVNEIPVAIISGGVGLYGVKLFFTGTQRIWSTIEPKTIRHILEKLKLKQPKPAPIPCAEQTEEEKKKCEKRRAEKDKRIERKQKERWQGGGQMVLGAAAVCASLYGIGYRKQIAERFSPPKPATPAQSSPTAKDKKN